jgi:pyruvate dehydrogenase E2 component (dihydrolipoamide acetyltransferase)
MPLAVAPATVGALLAALAFGLAADAVTVATAPPARQASSAPATAEPEVASAPKPVRQAKSACRLIVGWPDCAPKSSPKPEPPPPPAPAPQPAPIQPNPDGPSPGCDWACVVEQRANTPAERPPPGG